MNKLNLFKQTLVVILLAFSPVLFAMSLGDAKASGYVGEKYDGYVGVVSGSAPSDVIAMVQVINAQRRIEYQQVANKNGTPLRTVEVLAGKKLINQTPSGQYVMLQSGAWIKK